MVEPEGSELSFEEAMARLEEIVARLESGNIPLEDTLRLFEEGMGLARHCASRLESVEKRMEQLLEGEDGGPVMKPFSLPEGETR